MKSSNFKRRKDSFPGIHFEIINSTGLEIPQ